jgi:hypothetical protein
MLSFSTQRERKLEPLISRGISGRRLKVHERDIVVASVNNGIEQRRVYDMLITSWVHRPRRISRSRQIAARNRDRARAQGRLLIFNSRGHGRIKLLKGLPLALVSVCWGKVQRWRSVTSVFSHPALLYLQSGNFSETTLTHAEKWTRCSLSLSSFLSLSPFSVSFPLCCSRKRLQSSGQGSRACIHLRRGFVNFARMRFPIRGHPDWVNEEECVNRACICLNIRA